MNDIETILNIHLNDFIGRGADGAGLLSVADGLEAYTLESNHGQYKRTFHISLRPARPQCMLYLLVS